MKRDDLARRVKDSEISIAHIALSGSRQNSEKLRYVTDTMNLLVKEIERLEGELLRRDMMDEADIVVGSKVAQIRPTGNFVPIKKGE